MGWHVIGKGTIDFPKDCPESYIDEVFSKMQKTKDTFYDLSKYYNNTKSQKYTSSGAIYFDMSGNKGIDYDPLDKIKDFILKKLKGKLKVGLIISLNEYSESDEGFHYEYEENEG